MRPIITFTCVAVALLFASAGVRAASLTWSYSADVLTLDPHASNNTFTNAFLGNVYESLVRMNDRIEIQPALANPGSAPARRSGASPCVRTCISITATR